MITNQIITGNIGDDTISIIILDNQNEIDTIDVKSLIRVNGRIGPWDLTINEKQQLLILNSYDESLIALDLFTKDILARAKLGRSPVCIRVYNKRIYILNCDSNSLSIMDEDSMILLEEIYLDEKPSDIQIDINTNTAYIANSNGNSISIINLTDNTMNVINITAQPFRLIVERNYIYILSYINNGVINYSSISSMDKVSKEVKEFKIKGVFIDIVMIDNNNFLLTNPEDGYLYNFNLDEKKLSKRIYLGGMPSKIIWDTKNMLYITDLLNSSVLFVDLLQNNIVKKIKVGKEPQGFILL